MHPSRRNPPRLLVADGWRRHWTCVLAAIFLALSPAARAAPATPDEYNIKAAFLFNFIQFVEWPENAFDRPEAPFRIGILGDDPFGKILDEILKGETLHGRTIAVTRSDAPADLTGCHVVFVSTSESRHIDDALSPLSTRPVLTIGETDGFARQGGIIAFYTEGKKIRFEINPATAKSTGLKISSELLRLGKIADAEPARRTR